MKASAREDAVPKTRPESADKGRDQRLAFERREKRRFRIALVLAFLFHLSMITVFEIVIAVPRYDVEYYNISLVSNTDVSTTAASARYGDMLALSGTQNMENGLPAIDLPVIEFAEIDRLRIHYDASIPLPDLDQFFEPATPPDSWERFGGELHRLGRSLRDLALPGDSEVLSEPMEKRDRMLLHRPAEGFEAYIEWSGPPYDRELLFAPPAKALWEVRPQQLERPLEIVFKVNASGRVTNVWSPMIENSELIDDVQMTLLQYRFAPLANDADGMPAPADSEQSGMFFIQAAGDTP